MDVTQTSLFKVLSKYFPFPILGHDKKGHVVRYLPSGAIDWIGLYTVFNSVSKWGRIQMCNSCTNTCKNRCNLTV